MSPQGNKLQLVELNHRKLDANTQTGAKRGKTHVTKIAVELGFASDWLSTWCEFL